MEVRREAGVVVFDEGMGEGGILKHMQVWHILDVS